MLTTNALIVAVATLLSGLFALWTNPRRGVNRVVFSLSVHVAFWLVCLEEALGAADGKPWVRIASSVGAWVPLHLWFLLETVRGRLSPAILREALPWFLLAVPLSIVPFTEHFIPAHSTATARIYGPAYFLYIAGAISGYVMLAYRLAKVGRQTSGARKIELQLLLAGGVIAATIVLALMAYSAIFRDPTGIRLQPVVVLLLYAVSVAGVTSHKLFDTKDFLFRGARFMGVVAVGVAAAIGSQQIFEDLVGGGTAIFMAAATALWVALKLREWMERQVDAEWHGTGLRREIFAASRRAVRGEELGAEVTRLAHRWLQAERVQAFPSAHELFAHFPPPSDAVGARLLSFLGNQRWLTPERLERERETEDGLAMRRYLRESDLSALVVSGPDPDAVYLAVGQRQSQRPFTYPEIQQLLEMVAIIEAAYARLNAVAKAQRAEQLATVGVLGASVAHEIRNPLVSIKAFSQLLPSHYQDAVFRERFSKLLTDEVNRIDRLTEQLMDLAAPRSYHQAAHGLHELLEGSLDLIRARAREKNVSVELSFAAQPDRVWTDPNAVRQVILNLSFNAIQAQEGQARDRWLRLSTRTVPRGVELSVSDNGPGIPAEARAKLFEAFHSTKSSGFGLGLAICQEILSRLDTPISVDPPVPGQGATFRVTFACPPRSS
jgi:signal transduction histidine kinase